MSDLSEKSIRKLPAARGLAWVSGSWHLVRRQPLRLLLVSLFFQFFLSFSQADILGLLVILCLPALSAGMLHAFYIVEHGEKPMLAVLFLPFTAKNSVTRLLLLGGVVLVLGLLLVSFILAGQVVDIDPQIISRIEQGDLDALQFIDPKVMESAVVAMAIAAAVSGAITYFSVPLIWFRKQATGKSIFLGLKAMGRNWKPLLVIGCLLGILAIPIAILFASFYLSALGGGTASTWLAFVLLLLGPLFQLLLFGTQYMAFRDIFGLDEATAVGSGKSTTDQLVA
jgi:hypothetical protein